MYTILIVDDEKPIRELINMTLTDAGYACVTAEDGQVAADLIETRNFDLVLLDIMLPYIDGYELIEYIAPLNMPVIFLTAKSDVVDRVKGLRMGADDYIVKPFEPSELVARVESVLRRVGKGKGLIEHFGVTLNIEERTVMRAGERVVLPRVRRIYLLFLCKISAKRYTANTFMKAFGAMRENLIPAPLIHIFNAFAVSLTGTTEL